jgi:hypothetical protein
MRCCVIAIYDNSISGPYKQLGVCDYGQVSNAYNVLTQCRVYKKYRFIIVSNIGWYNMACVQYMQHSYLTGKNLYTMKKFTIGGFLCTCRPALLLAASFYCQQQAVAQCNVNDKYDKIISGYHSSIALKDNGGYAVWGSSMNAAGTADVLAPQDINSTNYAALTGTIYEAALGGKSAGASVDQGILLTSTGLWAWGVTGNVLKSIIKSTTAFGRIVSPSGGVGSTALGLPSNIAPEDVQALFATYQTLILLTKISGGSGGNVYVLTQTSLAAEANGGTVGSAGSSSWVKVKTDASTYLNNVTAVRGRVYNTTNNAFIAQKSNGQLYTWGNTSYTGSGAAAARNYATLMTLPAESAVSIIPRMIGVTGGGGTGATTVKNTYYVLSTTGNLYGCNISRCQMVREGTATRWWIPFMQKLLFIIK